MWQGWGRIILTAIVWLSCAGVSMSTLFMSNNIYSGFSVMMVVFPLLIALITTAILWVGPELGERLAGRRANSEKAKRRGEMSRLEMLTALMDEDELAAFKAALRDQVLLPHRLEDGELPGDAEELSRLLR
jgi:hypothetical protein